MFSLVPVVKLRRTLSQQSWRCGYQEPTGTRRMGTVLRRMGHLFLVFCWLLIRRSFWSHPSVRAPVMMIHPIRLNGFLCFLCQPNNKDLFLSQGAKIRGGSVNICDIAPSLKIPYKKTPPSYGLKTRSILHLFVVVIWSLRACPTGESNLHRAH